MKMFVPFTIRSFKHNLSSKLLRLSFKRYYSPLVRSSNAHFQFINHRVPFYLLGTVAISTSLYAWNSKILISNDQNDVKSANRLKGDPRADTYEMGLYLASQEEQRTNRLKRREEKLRRTKSTLYRLALQLYFVFDDHIWTPISITCRFLEISIFVLPIIISFPVAFFLSSSINSQTWWFTMIRMALQSLGPSFIKLGQWAASRTDLFPDEFCRILGDLHSKGKPHSFKFTEQKLCELFQVNSLDDVFENINRTPVGVGAIAQVYIVKFNESFIKYTDGKQWFALKILHPNVADKISKDLKIMKFGAMLINSIPTMEWLSLPDEVSQFSILMNLQLDLRIESLNLRKFRENFAYYPRIEFPEPLLKFSNTNILFEEYIEGFPMESFLDVKNLISNVSLSKKVSDPFVDAFLKMLILDDFIHSDLHPGNVLIKFVKMDNFQKRVISTDNENADVVIELKQLYDEDKEKYVNYLKSILASYTPQIYFIDAGLVTELNDLDRVNFIDLFKSLVKFDGYRAGELMIERSRTPETATNGEEFAQKVEKLVSTIRNQTFTLGTVSVGNLLDQMLSMVRVHHVRMEADFVSVVVAILLLEGIGRQLDPNLDLFDSSVPILREYAMTRERSSLLNGTNTFTMMALWLGLELRQWMNLSVKQIKYLIKTDQLCPNY